MKCAKIVEKRDTVVINIQGLMLCPVRKIWEVSKICEAFLLQSISDSKMIMKICSLPGAQV